MRSALAAGVAGIVTSEELESVLGPCVEAVLAGQACVPREHWRQIDPPALSTREKQILGLVVMGYMNSQIARQLFLAESTVKSHLSSAFGKLGVRSRNEAVNLILDPERGPGDGHPRLSAGSRWSQRPLRLDEVWQSWAGWLAMTRFIHEFRDAITRTERRRKRGCRAIAAELRDDPDLVLGLGQQLLGARHPNTRTRNGSRSQRGVPGIAM